jgi:hypothetical protein
MKTRSKSAAEAPAKRSGREHVARKARGERPSKGTTIVRARAQGTAWNDDFSFRARLVCYEMIEGAQHVERVARAALAVLEEANPQKAQQEACTRWLRALQRLGRPLRRFVDRQPWRYGQRLVSGTYETTKALLHELVRDFRRRRDGDQFAEDADLANVAVDALLPDVDRLVGDVLPSFAPLRENLVEWLVRRVAPEGVRKINYEHKAQKLAAELTRRSVRQVQDVVARSRKYEAVQAPLLFPDS